MAGLLFLKKEMMLDLKESTQAFCQRGREERERTSFHVEGPMTEKARKSAVGKKKKSLVRGIIWRLRVSEAERRVREGV